MILVSRSRPEFVAGKQCRCTLLSMSLNLQRFLVVEEQDGVSRAERLYSGWLDSASAE